MIAAFEEKPVGFHNFTRRLGSNIPRQTAQIDEFPASEYQCNFNALCPVAPDSANMRPALPRRIDSKQFQT
ncbi:hypothetical protein [Cypionkella sinensis]|uniref:Uncharacterized protein n=1 Tax=Cypionkella sinensis TaxID=1756043 RepID=A0ABV7IU40_9RHOB